MNHTRLFLLAGFIFGISVSFLNCGGNKCDAKSCANGCCDAKGVCQAGTSTAACGKLGATCAACAGATPVCGTQVCQATGSGGSGGSTGGAGGSTGGAGGSTGGAGGSAACRTVPSVTTSGVVFQKERFRDGGLTGNAWWEADGFGAGTTSSTFDLSIMQRYFTLSSPVTFPATVSLTVDGWLACSDCAVYLEECDSSFTCARMYMGQSGTVNYTTGTGDEDGGTMTGSATNVHMKEWDCAGLSGTGTGCTDTEVTGGACLDVTSWTWAGCFPKYADGGGCTYP